MEAEASNPGSASPGDRRRRRRRRRRSHSGVSLGRFAWLRSTATGNVVLWSMSLLLAAHVALTFYFTWISSVVYGPVALGMDKSEVRYRMGPPAQSLEGDALWTHREAGAHTVLRFDAGGLITSMSCTEFAQDSAGCPETMGLQVGSTEEDVFLRLGAPSRETFIGNDKVVHYDGIGLSLRLRRLAVVSVEKHMPAGFLSFGHTAAWNLVP